MLKTRRRIIMRSIALLLSMLIAFYAIPSVIFAEVSDAIDSIGTSETGNAKDESASIIKDVFEVKELREENVKTFRLEDGSFVAAQYPSAVHRLDGDGVWQDIDNTLSSSGSEFSTSDARVKFAKKITGNDSLFTLHEGNAKITFSLDGAIKKTSGTVKAINAEPTDETKLGKLMTLNKLSSSVVYKNILDGVDIEYIVTSNDIKENIIVKEKSDSYSYSFTVKLNNLTATLTEKGDIHMLDGEGNISYRIPAPVIFDANGNYADSSVGSYALTDNENGSYTLTVTANAEWMNAEDRAFPITVDPTIGRIPPNLDFYISEAEPDTVFDTDILRVSSSSSDIGENIAIIRIDTPSYLPNNAYIVSAELRLHVLASDDVYVGAYRALGGFSTNITYNDLCLRDDFFDSNPMSYEKVSTNYLSNYYKTFDITKLIKLNHAADYLFTVGLKTMGDGSVAFSSCTNTNGNIPRVTVTYKNLNGIEDYLSYSSQSIGSITSHVNLANGNLTVSIPTLTTADSLISFTPTLVYNTANRKNIITYENAEVPYTFDESSAPKGYKWNMRQSVIKKKYLNQDGVYKDYCIWSDGDGTEHYFYKKTDSLTDTTYYDEDGLLMTLEEGSDSLTITDANKTVMTFSAMNSPSSNIYGAWTLTGIENSIGNKLIIVYDYYWKPTEIKVQPNGSNAISMLKIWYTDRNIPAFIENVQTREAVVFLYEDEYDYRHLTSVIYAKRTGNPATSWFSYQQSPEDAQGITVAARYDIMSHQLYGTIDEITDTVAQKSLVYYCNDSNHLANSVYERISPFQYGQSIKYEYYIRHTDVYTSGSDDIIDTDDDIRTRYSFDNNGRTVSYYSSNKAGDIIYGAASGKYDEGENSKNNIKESTAIGGSATNYILNGGFEKLNSAGSFEYWSKSSADNVRVLTDRDAEGSRMAGLAVSASTSEYLYQEVFVPAGKYVVSFDLKTQIANDVSIVLSVSSLAGSGFAYTKTFPYEDDWLSDNARVSAGFEVPSIIKGGDRLEVRITATGGTSCASNTVIHIDEVMFEEGIGASDYSLVNAGKFEVPKIDASGKNLIPLTKFWTLPSGQTYEYVTTESLFGTSLKISADITAEKYVKQRIYTASASDISYFDSHSGNVTSTSDNTYIVSGFARSFAAIAPMYQSNGTTLQDHSPTFRIRVDVGYYQGNSIDDEVVSHYFDFLPGCTEWQFLSASFATGPNAENGNYNYNLVSYIDISCEYSYQASSYAAFDNISVICSTDENIARYKYYPNGLIESASYDYYKEEYVYDSNNNLTQLTNSRNEKYVYTYLSGSSLPDSEFYYVSGTLKRITNYNYNSFGQCIETATSANFSAEITEQIILKQTYKDSGVFVGALLTEEDSLGRTVRYFYDSIDGKLLATVNEDSGDGTAYVYDSIDRLTAVRPASYVASSNSYSQVTNSEEVEYTYDARNMLSQITTESTVYNFVYDSFGNTTSIGAGDSTLATYTYNNNNGKLKSITYGNGLIEEYVYNDLDMVSEIWYTKDGVRTKAYSYFYTSDGKIAELTDHLLGKGEIYTYGTDGKLDTIAKFDSETKKMNFTEAYTYNDKGLLSVSYLELNHTFANGYYTYINDQYNYYTSDDKIRKIDVSYGERFSNLEYTYDDFNRIEQIRYSSSYQVYEEPTEQFINVVEYGYTSSDGNTSTQISSYKTTVNSLSKTYFYTYDANGNITKVNLSTGEEIRYVYDGIGQLIREDNGLTGYTYVYAYDNAGNIISSKRYTLTAAGSTPSGTVVTKTYSYTDDTWGDLLTSFKGHTITYDEIGNPLSYYNGTSYTFTWNGRQLMSATIGNSAYSFTYDDQGMRTSKTKDGKTVNYYYSGGLLIGEASDDYAIFYMYSGDTSPVGMIYYDQYGYPEYYWYEKNLQGDIVAIYDENMYKVVSYTYDAWGNASITYSNYIDTAAISKNPFRYRGYYYDTNLSLYYLGSRYYDSNTGRFISPDTHVSLTVTPTALTDKNLFAYCDNTPVVMIVKNISTNHLVTPSNYSALPTSDVGAAKPYNELPLSYNDNTPNCYAYAIGFSSYLSPGGISGRIPTDWGNINDVAKSVEADLIALGYTVRRIYGPDSKVYDNEFKIAFRVTTKNSDYYLNTSNYDYHFMLQTNTGQWAEKHGPRNKSILWDLGLTPETIPWKINGQYYYDSEIYYFAVGT